jgi:outer membrane receptor for ferrienterochelin and colicins
VRSETFSAGSRMSWKTGGGRLSVAVRALDESRQGGDLATFENPFAEGAEHIATSRYEAGIGYDREIGTDSKLTINLAFASHERNATNDTFVGDYIADMGVAPRSDILEPYIADEGLWVVDAAYSRKLGESHTLLAGFMVSGSALDETGMYYDAGEPVPADRPYQSVSEKSSSEFGVYVQDELKLSDRTEMLLGARYDFHSSEDVFGKQGGVTIAENKYEDGAFNPRVSLKYKASDKTSLRFSAGTGFRVPYGFSEDLHLCSGSPRVYKGGDLVSERSVSVGLGADYVSDRYSVSTYVFRTDLSDRIDFADADPAVEALGYDYQWENVGDAFTQGVELGAEIALGPVTSLGLDATYTDAQYEAPRDDWVGHPVHGDLYADENQYLSRVPEWTLGLNLIWRPSDWTVALGVDVTGPMYIDYNEDDDVASAGSYIKHTEAFAIANLRVARQFGRNAVFFGAKNLFDEVQEERHTDDAAFIYAPLTGREIYAGVEVRF